MAGASSARTNAEEPYAIAGRWANKSAGEGRRTTPLQALLSGNVANRQHSRPVRRCQNATDSAFQSTIASAVKPLCIKVYGLSEQRFGALASAVQRDPLRGTHTYSGCWPPQLVSLRCPDGNMPDAGYAPISAIGSDWLRLIPRWHWPGWNFQPGANSSSQRQVWR